MLLPRFAEDADPLALYAGDDRPPPPDRPWVLVNMIATVDGATSVGGVSGPLGGAPDKRVFGAVRALPDVILVAAGTVRAEHYGPPRPSDAVRAMRVARGQRSAPRLAIVTSALDLDLSGRVFAEAEPDARPIVITTHAAPADRVEAAREVADVVEAGAERVAVVRAVGALHASGARVVLCEGGPSLVGQLVAAELVDELCLTQSPLLASGDSPRVAHGLGPATPTRMRLDRILEEDGLLFCRYVHA